VRGVVNASVDALDKALMEVRRKLLALRNEAAVVRDRLSGEVVPLTV
jgi:hypothetical protein